MNAMRARGFDEHLIPGSQLAGETGAVAWTACGIGHVIDADSLGFGLQERNFVAIRFTPLADPLLQYVNASRTDLSGTMDSLLTPINYNADIFSASPTLLTGNYGFEGYIGIPGLSDTGATTQDTAAANNVAWENIDPSLNAAQRAYTSAVSDSNALNAYGLPLLRADTLPLVFSHPVLPPNLNGSDFRVTLSDGSVVTPQTAAFSPNLEFNERQTVVLVGEFGNRLQPGEPGALYPSLVTVVNDGSPLELLTSNGPVSAVGLSVASSNPYVSGYGPRVVAAKLNRFSNLGEGGPIGISLASQFNSGGDLYGDQAQFRLRLYTSLGSPDGIASLLPSEFSRYFVLEATAEDGSKTTISQAGTPVPIGNLGVIEVVGLADLAQAGTTENAAYVEDHDNYYDIILRGDIAAISRLSAVRMPSSGSYQAVYDPGGPGNDPGAPGAAPGPFTVASSDHSVAITPDLEGRAVATFVEVEGPVLRNPFDGRPIGSLLGTAVEDTVTGQRINALRDPEGLLFYTSFAPASDQATTLPTGRSQTDPIDLIDTRAFTPGSSVTVSGSVSRSAGYGSTLQFYAVLDQAGTIQDPLTGQILQPGHPGYRQAALSATNLVTAAGSNLSAPNLEVLPFAFNISGGQLFAPVLTVQETGEVFFSFAAANQDRVSHFTGYGTNRYGIEDLDGGGDADFDDLIVRFNLSG